MVDGAAEEDCEAALDVNKAVELAADDTAVAIEEDTGSEIPEVCTRVEEETEIP